MQLCTKIAGCLAHGGAIDGMTGGGAGLHQPCALLHTNDKTMEIMKHRVHGIPGRRRLKAFQRPAAQFAPAAYVMLCFDFSISKFDSLVRKHPSLACRLAAATMAHMEPEVPETHVLAIASHVRSVTARRKNNG